MILQTLAEYHQVQVAIGNPHYAPMGTELKRIHFVLVLRGDGVLIDIEQPEHKVCVAKSRERGGKDAPLIANRMWDNIRYVAGYGADERQQQVASIQYRSFREQVRAIHTAYPENLSFAAVDNFYYSNIEQLYRHPLWEQITSKPGHNLSFRLTGELLLASQQKELLTCCTTTKHGRCSLSGYKTAISHTHPKLHINGCSPTGAKLVSFTKNSGYDSYLKRGCDNAPVSTEIAEGYSAALTGLLQPGSDNRIVVGSVTFLFYTLPDSDFNRLFYSLLGADVDGNRTQTLQRIKTDISQYADAEFVLMALVPNAARISVRLYVRTTVKQVVANIIRFYDEAALDNNFKTSDSMALLSPLFASAPMGDITKLPQQLIVDYIEAITQGVHLPVLMQQNLLNRLQEHTSKDYSVCSMLRCYLNRNLQIPITMALDKSNRNIGYILGRLFAIIERVQELSTPNINFTIRDTYYNTISITPAAVFNRLIGLSSSFFRRIPSLGTTIYMKAEFGEVIDILGANGIPMRLSLDEQSHFALGYFHQRQTYFKKRDINEPDNRE